MLTIELTEQIKTGEHPQFIYDKEKQKITCRCGLEALWFQNGYLCPTVTAYPCRYNKMPAIPSAGQKDKDPDIWYCDECGSTDVEMKQWTLPNQGDKLGSNDSPDRNDCWCNDCQDNCKLELTTASKYSEIKQQFEKKEEDQ
ncbi:MAG: hypothetical protein LBS20_11695 [Prevotella sp.]|jgi:hypothetical protein|nr:hypothetical protein [Prevotella sp.]